MPAAAGRRPDGFGFNAGAGRYTTPDGRFVAARAVRDAVDQVVDGVRGRVVDATNRMLGDGQVDRWKREMSVEMRAVHTLAAVTAKGGFAQMTPADWGRVGQVTRQQYAYLDNFAQELATGQTPLTGAVVTRASMYADAGVGTYERMQRTEMQGRTMTLEYNILGDADHCDDCLEETNQGRVSIGTLSLPGNRRCRTRCRCRLGYA